MALYQPLKVAAKDDKQRRSIRRLNGNRTYPGESGPLQSR
jgi:hypothetical protein